MEQAPVTLGPLVSKPCADCGVPVLDRDDPTFEGAWTCYWCHCTRNGFDHKERLNGLATGLKLMDPPPPRRIRNDTPAAEAWRNWAATR